MHEHVPDTGGDDMHRKTIAPLVIALAAIAGGWRDANTHTRTLANATHSEHAERVIGYGQVRFRGAGPELWAQRFRRERRAVNTLRARLAARLDRIVYLVQAFECIHTHEGAWNDNTGNGYYGGLQFGAHEWSLYGGGYAPRADLASPSQQIAAGITYQALSGFYPWPATARMCGLIR